jgi:outer membrane protein OmpA-like peptidoglycan-associated protein
MRKIIIVFTVLFIMFQIHGNVAAQSDDLNFIMQKAKSSVEKILSRSHETKPFTADVQSAQNYLKKAETELKNNTNWRGKTSEAAVPTIKHYANMAEIMCQVVLSRLEKANQEQENTRLEKFIPETDARIKIFDDKNKEIKLLKEELAKPKGDIKNVSGELSALKLDKINMLKEVASLKAEKANLTGQVEALNGVVGSLKNDVVDKTKKNDELNTENNKLKEDMKALESQKGEDVVKTQNKVIELNKITSFWHYVNKMDVLSKLTATSIILIIPRHDLIKTPALKLAPEAGIIIGNIAALMKKYPDIKAQLKVHGFGKPDKTENTKATEQMAGMLKEALLKKGVAAANLDISGAGSSAPLYSKSAVEDNKRVEITFSGIIARE